MGVISRSAKAEQQRDQGSLTRAAIEKETFARTNGNARDAPKPDLALMRVEFCPQAESGG